MPALRPFKRPEHILILCLLFFIVSNTTAQNRQIDSLNAVLPSLPQDSARAKTLILLARRHLSLRDGKTLTYATQAYELSTRINYKKGVASAAVQLGRYFTQQGKQEDALKYFHEANEIFKHYGNRDGMAACFNNIGVSYFYKNRYDSAINNYQRSLELYRAINNQEEVAKLIANIGVCYEYQGDYTRALESYFKALEVDELTGNMEAVAADISSIAIVYKKEGDLEKALAFHQRALHLCDSLGDSYGIASSYANLGPVYVDLGEYEKALEALNKALIIFKDVNDKYGEGITLNNIGAVYIRQKDFKRAARYYRKSLALEGNDTRRLDDLTGLAEAYTGLSKPASALMFAQRSLEVANRLQSHESAYKVAGILYQAYKANNDFRNALLYHEKYMASKDSLFNKEKISELRELQTKYETGKKEQQIAILNSEKALQESKLNTRSLLLIGSIGIILLVITLSYVLIRSNRSRQESERKLLNEQLRNEKMEAEKLQELDEMKSRFFANIAHEFRTPLTLISGPVENLIEESDDKHMKDQLKLVKKNSERLLKLVNQLLDLSKLESGAAKLEPSKDDIISFMKGLAFSFQSLADEKDITLQCVSDTDRLTMDFDKDKLEKIAFNLLSNAFKFTPNLGTITVSLSKVLTGDQHLFEIRIEDSGPGIPQDQLPFIFDRFYQADNAPSHNMEGSGIGLALTKELVELHDGNIRVESETGQGTVFIVQLPVKDDKNIAVVSSNKKHFNASHFPEGNQEGEYAQTEENTEAKSELILVIEDNYEVREFIIKSLIDEYNVISATGGDEGITMAIREIPDLIISDVMMPGKNGYDTCRNLKGDERTSHIPVVLLTAKAGLENKIEGLETGADDFMAKPFSTRELRTRIKNLIATRRKLRQKFLNNALSAAPVIEPTIEDTFLVKTREAIEAHLDEADFSIEDLSRELGMSRTQVHRKLKALTNQSASQFMRTIRLQHARVLLQKGQLNISEVAYQVGFSSPTYFSTCYASHYGHAPSDEKVSHSVSPKV